MLWITDKSHVRRGFNANCHQHTWRGRSWVVAECCFRSDASLSDKQIPSGVMSLFSQAASRHAACRPLWGRCAATFSMNIYDSICKRCSLKRLIWRIKIDLGVCLIYSSPIKPAQWEEYVLEALTNVWSQLKSFVWKCFLKSLKKRLGCGRFLTFMAIGCARYAVFLHYLLSLILNSLFIRNRGIAPIFAQKFESVLKTCPRFEILIFR